MLARRPEVETLARAIRRIPSLPEGVRYLNQRVYYDGSIAAEEIGLPQTPVSDAIRRGSASNL